MRTTLYLRLAGLSAAGLVLAGCGAGQDQVEITQLTIETTTFGLDQATSMAVAEYVEAQGIDVEIREYDNHEQVFSALESRTEEDHVVLGIVTRHQDPAAEERTADLPESIDVVAQAPAELGFVAAASPVTAANFAREVANTEDPQAPQATACADQTWFEPPLADEQLQPIAEALAQDGCEPTFEIVEPWDVETYNDLLQQLVVEPGTVALLRGVDPAIPDQGLATLDVETDQWPHSNVIAIAHTTADEPLTNQVTDVLEVLDSEAATDLLRGYYNAQTSVSDLQYEVDDAVRYWLAQVDLMEPDTVINITDAND